MVMEGQMDGLDGGYVVLPALPGWCRMEMLDRWLTPPALVPVIRRDWIRALDGHA
jgi:hypothetical protein